MDFSEALNEVKRGAKVSRSGWNGSNMYIAVVETPNEWYAYLGEPLRCRQFFYMKTVDNQLVPWVATQTDLLADDWHVVE